MLTEEYSEFICDECHGTGRVRVIRYGRKNRTRQCPRCNGTGKLDWIEHITGKHYKNLYYMTIRKKTV